MAKLYALNLLPFLFIALTILNLSSISAIDSSNQEIDAVIEALRSDGNFTIWAKLLEISKARLVLPTNATIFVPSDAAISHLSYATDTHPYLIPYHINPSLIPYHITTEHHLLLSDLYHLKPLSLLPTLVPRKTIVITSTLLSSYKIDNAIITHPDIYLSSQLVVHGINRILDLHPQ